MREALRAEWSKMRTVPDAAITLPLAVALTVGLALLSRGSRDPVHGSLLGVQLGQAVVAVWAVQVLAGEYGSGLIRATFTAVPRRLIVLAAKGVLVLAGVLAVSVLSVTASVLAGRWLSDGYPAPASGAVLRAAGGSVLYLLLIALLGLGVAAMVRSAVAAAGLVLGLLYFGPFLANVLGDVDWQRAAFRIMPSTAGTAIQTTVDARSLPIGPWAGLGVAAAWAFGALALGALILRRRDV